MGTSNISSKCIIQLDLTTLNDFPHKILNIKNKKYNNTTYSSYVYFSVIVILYIIHSGYVNRKSIANFLINQKLLYSFLIAFTFFSVFVGNNNSASVYNRIASIDFQEKSTQTRLRFYFHGINHIKNNIFVGVGLGNWKVKSIEYDAQNMNSYIVPFYLHNDFLEAGTELGIIGMFLYLGMFIYILASLLKANITNIGNELNTLPFYILFLCITIYFIDSNLNFPHGRAISQVTFNIILALSLIKIISYEKQ